MGIRTFALIFGVFYLLVGVLGLIPGLLTPVNMPGVTVDVLSGNLLGIFPVNIVHTIVHLALGLWGVFAYRTFDASRTYARSAGVIFLVLFVFGLIPGLNTLFGLTPLHGADVWLHLVSGIVALAFGLTARKQVDVETTDHTPPPVI